jgi:hypothetical protein
MNKYPVRMSNDTDKSKLVVQSQRVKDLDQFQIIDSLNASRLNYKFRNQDLIDYYTLKQFESKFKIE